MPTGRIKGSALLLSLLALGLAVAAQLNFAQGPDEGLLPGLLLYSLAAFCLVVAIVLTPAALHSVSTPDILTPSAAAQPARRYPYATVLIILGSLAVVYAALVSGERGRELPRNDLLVVWLLGLLAVMSAMGVISGLQPFQALRSERVLPETVLIGVLFVGVLLVSATDLRHIPYVLSGDEAEMGLEAVKVLRGELANPFATGIMGHPTLFFYVQAIALWLGGISTAALRLPSALASAVAVIWLYKLVKRWYSARTALITALFYVGYHVAVHYARLGLNNIWDVFFVLGVLWYAQRGLDENSAWPWAVSGLLLGLSIYFYLGSRFTVFILAAFLLIRWLQGAQLWRRQRGHIAVLAGVTLLAALPLLNFFLLHLADMSARWSVVSILSNGWLQSEPLVTGKTQTALLIEQFLKSALAFNLYPDRTPNYDPGMPLMQFGMAICFVFGLITSLAYPRRRLNVLLLAWFLAVVIVGGMLLDNPPNSGRFVLLIPVVLLLAALGLEAILDLLAVLLAQPRWLATLAAVSLALVMSYASLRFYFVTYAPSATYGGQNTEVADAVGYYLQALGPSYRCYFFGAPRMFYNFGTIRYLAQGVVGLDAPADPAAPLDWINAQGHSVFVFVPERFAEIETMMRLYPGGTVRQKLSVRADPLFYSYEVDVP
ncbi:MAG: glycosyltransferase family 39 protein [Anaerolineae bacterium]